MVIFILVTVRFWFCYKLVRGANPIRRIHVERLCLSIGAGTWFSQSDADSRKGL